MNRDARSRVAQVPQPVSRYRRPRVFQTARKWPRDLRTPCRRLRRSSTVFALSSQKTKSRSVDRWVKSG